MDKTEKIYNECLKEMFSRVGEKFPNKELTNQQNWYELRSWTAKEQKRFELWMQEYVRKKTRCSKGIAKSMTAWFSLMYSWTNVTKLPKIKTIIK